MKNRNLLLSLCIPTNGITKWVKEVLESIFEQENLDNKDLYEVVVCDNGENIDFYNYMIEQIKYHSNLVYIKSKKIMFQNQIEAFRHCNGEMIKFVNHRMKLKDGSLDRFIQYSIQYANKSSLLYFLNGNKKLDVNFECNNFNVFLEKLGYFITWSAGICLWKKDLDKLPDTFNEYFPHLDIISMYKNSQVFIINNDRLLCNIDNDSSNKGKYDLYDVFAVHFIEYLKNLKEKKNISKKTFKKIFRENGKFIAIQYNLYNLQKLNCSYNINSFDEKVAKYYHKNIIKLLAYIYYVKFKIKK